jgi:hypothetical protein
VPLVRVLFYMEDDGTVPMTRWLEDLRSQPKHRAKCIKWLTLLRDFGHDLRRPKADFLSTPLRKYGYVLSVITSTASRAY